MEPLLELYMLLSSTFFPHRSFTAYFNDYSQLSIMARKITVAAAQVGAVHKDSQRSETLSRLIALLEEASKKGVQVLVYP